MIELNLIGNLGADAIEKNINGKNYISFRVAHTQKHVDKDGVINEVTQWVSVLMPTRGTELIKHLRKGTKVYVSGLPRFSTYKATKSNVTGYFVSVDIMCEKLELCGGKSQSDPEPADEQQNENVIF